MSEVRIDYSKGYGNEIQQHVINLPFKEENGMCVFRILPETLYDLQKIGKDNGMTIKINLV